MERKLVIIGAGGHGKVVADAAERNAFQDICFLDDDEKILECGGFPVVGKSCEAEGYIGKADIFVAVGNPRTRQQIQEWLCSLGAEFPVLCHPNAVIGTNVEIGAGTVIMAGAVINPSSRIGRGCIINTCASVDHDCQIEDYVHVSVGAHLAGAVHVRMRTWIGAGAVISNNINISGDCMIGAGAVVVKNIEKSGIYLGVPAEEKHMRNTKNIPGGGNSAWNIKRNFDRNKKSGTSCPKIQFHTCKKRRRAS